MRPRACATRPRTIGYSSLWRTATKAGTIAGDTGPIRPSASAALALGPWLLANDLLPADGTYVVRQGIELGRPSTLHGQAQVVDGHVVSATVTGAVLPAATGHLTVPARVPA